MGIVSAFLPWDILANLTWNIHTFLPEHILADFLWDITASILWNIFTNFMRDLTLNNLCNISAHIPRHSSAVVHIESVAQLVDYVVAVLPGNINTVLLRSINTMFSWHIIALRGGDIVAQLLVVVALLALPLSDRMTFLHVCSRALLLVRGGALLLVRGGALPGGDVLALFLGYPGADLLVHLPALPALHGLLGDGVFGVALLPGAGLALLVRHNLAHLVHLSLALPVGHRLAVLVVHLAAGPGRHRVADSVVLSGALTAKILVALLLDKDGTLPLLLGVALVVVHGGAVLVQQVHTLLLVDSLLELPLDRMALLLVDSVALRLSLMLNMRLLHVPALSRGCSRTVFILTKRLVVRFVMRLNVQRSTAGDKDS